MPYFHVDDTFSDSKEVIAIPPRLRCAAVGLWTLAGSWSAGKLTDGFVPDEVLRTFVDRKRQRDTLVAALIDDAELWDPADGGVRFRNWAKWQRTRSQVEQYRAANAGRQRRHRDRRDRPEGEPRNAVTNGVTPDAPDAQMVAKWSRSGREVVAKWSQSGRPETPRPAETEKCHSVSHDTPKPIPIPNSGYLSSDTHVSSDEMVAPVAATPGADLVRRVIPREHPDAVKTTLRVRAAELIHAGTAASDVEAALELWLTKPHLGPNVLASLVSEVIKARAAPHANGRRLQGADLKAAQFQAMKGEAE